ncbi:MAG: thiosulfate dehydrogenase (quinone) large subunit [Solirubrobacterales bacterium]|jgi:thiosulfate dehydrogenase [quinone] large subunit|nr:thiosulfate dehydrogenase (quinone) large subunit [Solirubrobacterales bacterium]
MALLPLRIFLGITFIYAGVQKLSDPGFLHPGAPTYIGTQLEGFANGTPGGFILRTFALPHPQLAGVGVAITEILIGLLVGAGFLTRIAAAAGMGLNFLLFLTASWHTTPYFLGPDLVFTFAWLPFVIAGAEGQPSLDQVIDRVVAARGRRGQMEGRRARPLDDLAAARSTRRTLLAEFGGAAVAIAGVAALAKGTFKPSRSLASGSGGGARSKRGSGSPEGGATAGPPAPSGHSSGGSSVPAGATELGPSRNLPAEAAATYTDPEDGSPDIVIREPDGTISAFSAVCTHAGCTVGYEGGVIICPCHGGEYDAETGEVIAGPPPAPLAPKRVLESGGKIYALPS